MTTRPDLLAAARLSPPLARDVFRTVLDALSQPGRPYCLPVETPSELPSAIVPALALADLEVHVGVVGPEPDVGRWADVLRTATGASTVPPETADWLVALEPPSRGLIEQLPAGSSMSPESGARLTIACERIAQHPISDESATPDTPGVTIAVAGPGVPTSDGSDGPGRALRLTGVGSEVIAALIDKNRHFPAGLDTWLCATDRTVVGLPRSTRITVLGERRVEGAL